jgi:hypothetical protein
MSIYNISNTTTSNANLKASWPTGNSRSSILIKPLPPSNPTKPCTNFFAANQQPCDTKLTSEPFFNENKRSVYIPNKYFVIRPIRSYLIATAIRNGYYNYYSGVIEADPSALESLYYLPKQNLTINYSMGNKKFNINERILFLPANYEDVFNSKQIVILSSPDPTIGNDSEFATYSSVCSEEYNCFGLSVYFLDIGDTKDAELFGVSFNELKSIDSISTSPIILNVKQNNQIIVSVLYNSNYVNTEIVIKHPSIGLYIINLPELSQDIDI